MTKQKNHKNMTIATGNAVLRAFNKCAKRICDEGLTSTTTSAGFIIPAGQKRGHKSGWQVFVKMIRYSDAKLKRNRNSGGLAVRL